jgi:hypothetical protein
VATQKLEEKSKLVPLLYNDPKFFYYNGNPDNNRNGGGLGNFTQNKIKFGGDRRGSGDSGQPYITTPIPLRLAQSIADDGFIRGGMATADRASQIDTERINRFLKDKPRGPLFIQRQVKLQFSNPKLEVKKYTGSGDGLFGIVSSAAAGLFNVVNELIPGPTRLYNQGFNTIAQIGATAFGRHFERHGLTPVQDDNTKYLAVAQFNNKGNGNNNRLVGLKNQLIKPTANPQNFLNSANFIINNINALFKTNIPTKGLQPQDLQIANYLGGPDSIYGNGRTIIRRFDITSNGFNRYDPLDEKVVDYNAFQSLFDLYNNTETIITTPAFNLLNPEAALTRKQQEFVKTRGPIDQTAVDYNIGKGANIPAGSNPIRDTKSPTTREYSALKNQIAVQSAKKTIIVNGLSDTKEISPKVITIKKNTTNFQYHSSSLDNIESRNDSNILSVIFRIVDPFTPNPGDDSKLDDIVFSAYLSGFKDNFDASWNEYNYIGRSESFYTYGKFKRNVNFNLDIPCFNRTELQLKHRALGQLASTTAGAYNGNNLLGGVLIKLYIGKYVYGQYGILNNLSYEIPQDASWDVNERLAMTIKTSFSFTIVQANLPQYKNGEGFFNYITPPPPGVRTQNTATIGDLVTKFTK